MKIEKVIEDFGMAIHKNLDTIVGFLFFTGIGWIAVKNGYFTQNSWADVDFDSICYDEDEIKNDDKNQHSDFDIGIMLVPENTVEAKVMSIRDAAISMTDDWYKYKAANSILLILNEEEQVSENTATFAIMCLNSIARSIKDSYYKRQIITMISKIKTK